MDKKLFQTELGDVVEHMIADTDLPMVFMITKTTKKKKRNFVVNKLKLDSAITNSFFSFAQETFVNTVDDLKKDTTKIKNFFDEDITSDDYSQLETKDIEHFSDIIQKIYEHRDDTIENEISMVEKASFFAVRFKIDDKLVVHFTKFLPSNIITERNWISAAFSGGSFTSIKGTNVVFPKKIDCIYVQSLKKLLIFNKEHMESMFDYYLYYQQKVDEMMDHLETKNKIIVFDKKFMHEIKITKQIPKKITKMMNDGKFDKTKEDFVQAKDLFEKNPDWTEEFTKLEFDATGATKVCDVEQLATVIGICDDSFARSYLLDEDIFAIKQTRLKKNNTQK